MCSCLSSATHCFIFKSKRPNSILEFKGHKSCFSSPGPISQQPALLRTFNQQHFPVSTGEGLSQRQSMKCSLTSRKFRCNKQLNSHCFPLSPQLKPRDNTLFLQQPFSQTPDDCLQDINSLANWSMRLSQQDNSVL